MYAINTSYPIPNRTYTIVSDHEYNRYVAYVATLDFGSEVVVGDKRYSAEDLRQMLLQADKVNQNQVALISRYGCVNYPPPKGGELRVFTSTEPLVSYRQYRQA